MSPDAEEERRGGNNPAHAGKRSCNKKQHDVEEEQPRTRGEKQEVDRVPQSLFGTTPHTRGKGGDRLKKAYGLGTTPHTRGNEDPPATPHLHHRNNPARAGKRLMKGVIDRGPGEQPRTLGESPLLSSLPTKRWEQPRTRGEKNNMPCVVQVGTGTTPHTRGK